MANARRGSLSRRQFVRSAAASAVIGGYLRSARADAAASGGESRPIRVGLVGCGGRGRSAAGEALAAAPNVQIVAIADVFQEALDLCYEKLSKATALEKKNCFLGFDAYRQVFDMPVDYVIFDTPPHFRPKHVTACIEAGKNVFMEKPVAVDPVGARQIMAAGETARKKGLSIVAGTQRRHQKGYIETIKRIQDGAIGKLRAGQVYWRGKQVRYKKRQAGWSDMDWMIRDWNNWTWLGGDHIVEQHVHNLDVMNWVLGSHPVSVVAMGGRHRRITGDQYDFFCSDFTYPNDVHVLSQARQINGCANEVSERIVGEKGVSNCNGWISTLKMEKIEGRNPYVQEHADLIAAIRTGVPINEAQTVAESTLTAIMARMSAYTGQQVTWDEVMKSDLVLGPPDYPLTEEEIRKHVPVPGKD